MVLLACLEGTAVASAPPPALRPPAPPPRRARPSWAPGFRFGTRTSLAELAKQRRHQELVSEVARRLQAGERPVESWLAFGELLPGLDPEEAIRVLDSLEARAAGNPASALLRARLHAHRAWPKLHRPERARAEFRRLGGDHGTLAGLARLELARLDWTERPSEAIAPLRSLVDGKDVPDQLAGRAALALGAVYQRAGHVEAARNLYLRSTRRFGRVPHGRGGSLAPWFQHGLAEALAALDAGRAARTELAMLLDTYPEYPGRQAARDLFDSLSKGR